MNVLVIVELVVDDASNVDHEQIKNHVDDFAQDENQKMKICCE